MSEEEFQLEEEDFEYDGEEEPPEEEAEEEMSEYDTDDMQARADLPPDSAFPEDLLDFQCSYGYDSLKPGNLCACDEDVVAWSAGSLVHYLDAGSGQTWTRRTGSGGTAGALAATAAPEPLLAVAECGAGGRAGRVVVARWPTMSPAAVLRGTVRSRYTALAWSADGELLAGASSAPRHEVTVWRWRRRAVLLRAAGPAQHVHTLAFSAHCPGQLTAAGAGHIRFWRMSRTFTGLKLKGESGRFGKTEICDILGVYPMPDEKVLSGSEWGNILVWEAGLVKLEVGRRGGAGGGTCHAGALVRLALSGARDEVTTAGADGCVRAWYWDTVETADPPEEDPRVMLNPVAEACVPRASILSMQHRKDDDWFIQDATGNVLAGSPGGAVLQLWAAHAGAVRAVCAGAGALASLGADGTLLVRAAGERPGLRVAFPSPGTCGTRLRTGDREWCTLVLGFADGVVRVVAVRAPPAPPAAAPLEVDAEAPQDCDRHSRYIRFLYCSRAASWPVLALAVSAQGSRLVCAGAGGVMLFAVGGAPLLSPLALLSTPDTVLHAAWHPRLEDTVLLGGERGMLLRAKLPTAPPPPRPVTYRRDFLELQEMRINRHVVRRRAFPTEEELASLDEEALRAKDEPEDEDLPEWRGEMQLVECEEACPVRWAAWSAGAAGADDVWVAAGGVLLLLRPPAGKPLKYAAVPGADDDEDITAAAFLCGGRYLVSGWSAGAVRVVRAPEPERDTPELHRRRWLLHQQDLARRLRGRRLAKPETEPTPRMEFEDHFCLQMHDRYRGALRHIELGDDLRSLYTCGDDGNVFSFGVNFPEPPKPDAPPPRIAFPEWSGSGECLCGAAPALALEEGAASAHAEAQAAAAAQRDAAARAALADLRRAHHRVHLLNRQLAASQRVPLRLDGRAEAAAERARQAAAARSRRRLQHRAERASRALHKMRARNITPLDVVPFTLRAIDTPEVVIRPLRQKNLSPEFYEQLAEVDRRLAEGDAADRVVDLFERPELAARSTTPPAKPSRESELPRAASVLSRVRAAPIPLRRALRQYHRTLQRHRRHFLQWQEHLSRRPSGGAGAGAARALAEARATVGNLVLKTQPEYVPRAPHRTQLRLCHTRHEIYDIKHQFNEKLLRLRQEKLLVVQKIRDIGARLADIRPELPPALARREPPAPPALSHDLEFPEDNLEVCPEPVHVAKSAQAAKKDRRSSLLPRPRVPQARVPRFIPIAESNPLAASWEILKSRADRPSADLEEEVRERRVQRHAYEQDVLLQEAESLRRRHDRGLLRLQRERTRVQERSLLLELHLHQLHRELSVLQRFEAREDLLAGDVRSKLAQVQELQESMQDREARAAECDARSASLAESARGLLAQFRRLAQDSPFAAFLRRIFRKKYRPPADPRGDESSEESSSSSSSSEEEASSEDSRAPPPPRLDPGVCPDGCDPQRYQDTYDLRAARHEYEREMSELSAEAEGLRREAAALRRQLAREAGELESRQKTLADFMMEKQSCLNEVEQVVVLRYEQIRASALGGLAGPAGDGSGAAPVVLVAAATLTGLRRRVVELRQDILEQKQRRNMNRTHVHRMEVDARALRRRAGELTASTRAALRHKLGARGEPQDLTALAALLARRHAATNTQPAMRTQLREWQKKHGELEKRYMASVQRHSERLRLAAALQADVVPQKPVREPRRMEGGYSAGQYRRDVARLRLVRHVQQQQIQALEEEIKMLKLKPLSAPSPPPAPLSEPLSAPSELRLMDVRRPASKFTHKYFPIAPAESRPSSAVDVEVRELVRACGAARGGRGEERAERLLQALHDALPDITCGVRSRFDVVEAATAGWELDGELRARVFDAAAALLDRQQAEAMQIHDPEHQRTMEELEKALTAVAGGGEPMAERVARTLAALLEAGDVRQLENPETMATVVSALTADGEPLPRDELDGMDLHDVVRQLEELGVTSSAAEASAALVAAGLRAQLEPQADPARPRTATPEASDL